MGGAISRDHRDRPLRSCFSPKSAVMEGVAAASVHRHYSTEPGPVPMAADNARVLPSEGA